MGRFGGCTCFSTPLSNARVPPFQMSLINSGVRSLRINKTGEGQSTELQLKTPSRGGSGVVSTREI